jgi:hypothetical protein
VRRLQPRLAPLACWTRLEFYDCNSVSHWERCVRQNSYGLPRTDAMSFGVSPPCKISAKTEPWLDKTGRDNVARIATGGNSYESYDCLRQFVVPSRNSEIYLRSM